MYRKPTLISEYRKQLINLNGLLTENKPLYNFGTHIEALYVILHALNPKPDDILMEVGGGHFSTPILLATNSRVLTLEQGQNVSDAQNDNWLKVLKQTYQSNPNWTLMDLPGTKLWKDAVYPEDMSFCFVDGNGNCRKEIVDFMLARNVPVIAAHDSETKSFRYDTIKNIPQYSVYDYRGREVWTRVWSSNPAVNNAMDNHKSFVKLK